MNGSQDRGVRNNNPASIRRSADKWQGLADMQLDKAFFQFTAPTYGIRACARILITHQDKYGCASIIDHINKWAPPNENNTAAYIADVAKQTGFAPAQKLDMHDYAQLKPIVRAIIMHECDGYQYDDAVVDKSLVLAGVEPPTSDLQGSRTIAGAKVAGVSAVITAVTAAVQQGNDALTQNPWIGTLAQGLLFNHPSVCVAFSIASIAAIGYMTWARIDDKRRGLR